jgi:hypothetical protein
MWLTSDTEDEYIIRGVPAFLWGAAAALIGVGVYILFSQFASFLSWAKPVERFWDTLLVGAALFFIPAVGLSLFVIFPLIVTRINRKGGFIEYTKYRPLWVRTRRISFEQLDGGVHISEEYDSENGGNTYQAYFDLKNGERLKMCSEPGQFQGRNYDIAMRVNDILRNEEHYWTDKVPESGEEIVRLDLNG